MGGVEDVVVDEDVVSKEVELRGVDWWDALGAQTLDGAYLPLHVGKQSTHCTDPMIDIRASGR